MEELIKVNTNENLEPVVSGRELHKILEVATAYKDWFPRMCEYGFVEGQDFSSFLSESTGGRPAVDHIIKMDMAKEICMLQRTERGKLARQYFIQIEKEYNNPEKIMARALRIAEQELSTLKIKAEEMKPKALFADAVSASHTSILVGDLAKLLRQNGIDIGAHRLFEKLREKGFLMKSGSSKNMPTQASMNRGLFEIKEGSYINSDGVNVVTKTTKVTGKGQVYFVNLFLNAQKENL
jgi:phage antirepressor protein|nr:MAG TPA: KilAC domain protein [Caudoviricetes sp.]